MITDKVRPHHLERKALLYVRQSSAHQVLHNRESSALQYAMQDRLMPPSVVEKLAGRNISKKCALTSPANGVGLDAGGAPHPFFCTATQG
jgi:hypothetical protein